MMKGVNLSFTATNRAAPAMKSFQRDVRGAKRQLDATAVANKRFSESLGRSTWRRQVQQAGMQVSDFSVQVAGGQSAILAFTQNVPQFLQNFGAMGGVIAAAVTILGTFAFMSSRAAGSVLEFSKQIDETKGKVEEYFSLLQANKGLTSTLFDEAKESLKGTSQAVKDLVTIAKLEAVQSIENLAQSLANATTEAGILDKAMFKGDRAVVGDLLGIDTALRGHIGNWKEAANRVQEFIDVTRGIAQAGDIDTMLERAVKTRDVFKSHVDVTGELTNEQRKFWKQISQTIRQLELMGAATRAVAEGSRTGFEATLARIREMLDPMVEADNKARDTLATLRRQNEVLQAIRSHGADSAQVAAVRARHEREVFEAKLRSSEASADMKRQLREAFSIQQGLKVETEEVARQMSNAAAEAWKFVQNLGGASLAGMRAKLGALKKGASDIDAAAAKLRADLTSTDQFQNAMGTPFANEAVRRVNDEVAALREKMAIEKEISAIEQTRRTAETGSGGGGGASGEISKMRDELRELVDTAGPQLKELLSNTKNLTLETDRKSVV